MSRIPFRMPGRLSIEGLQKDLSNLVDRWWHCGLNTGPLDGQDWAPPVEIAEQADCYQVMMEMPGVSRSTLDVTGVGSTLQVTGERLSPSVTAPAEAPPFNVLHSERRYGGFKRLVTLPGPICLDEVSAELADGILTVRLPKAAGAVTPDIHIPIRAPDQAPASSAE
jgi:HSP20 family protein